VVGIRHRALGSDIRKVGGQEIDEYAQLQWHLGAAGILEIEAGEGRAPILQYAHRGATRAKAATAGVT
jgi:hypothetical protein